MQPQMRKADDRTILALNAVGLPMRSIARRLGIHHTTVAHRLRVLEVAAADTRRSFMEDVFDSLTEGQQQWLLRQVGPGRTVKGLVHGLIVREWLASRNPG